MITRHTRGKVTWIDIESPTHEELDGIMQEFGIDARIEEEIISPTPYPIVISFPSYVYLILHFPTSDPSGGTRNQEVDFIVGKNFLITARYEVIESLHNLHRVFEAEELLGVPEHDAHADVLVERVLRRLYGAIRDEIEQASYRLERIERDIFSGKERQMVRTISETARVLLRFETALGRHEEALQSFLRDLCAKEYFGSGFNEHTTHILAEREHAAALVSSYRSVAQELRITNDSLVSSKQNEIMKTLTIAAFIAFPLTVISSIFGMNVEHTPFVGHPYDFWIVICIMILSASAFFLYFKWKRWI